MGTDLHSLIILFLCVSTICITVHLQKNSLTFGIRVLLVFLVASSIFAFTHYGRMNIVKVDKPAFVEATGSNIKNTLFHWHEIYHYYLGAKYYKENGHFGLYNSVLLADKESSKPMITVGHMRDSIKSVSPITTEEGLKRAREIHRPNFTDERWSEFKRDLEYLKSISANDNWLNLGMFDAGYNAPPTWGVMGYTLSNIMPLSNSWFDYGPTWDQSEFLPLFDLLLMIIACIFIYRSFGLVGFSLFMIAFGTSFISGYSWVAGSFLRHIWLFGLIMGLCFVKDKKYLLAGVFLGLSCAARIFPLAFAGAIGLAMIIRWRQGQNSFEDITKYTIGISIVFLPLIAISFMMFGLDMWVEWYTNINVHKDMYFVAHIGYKKIATWDIWVPHQNFWWAEGLLNFQKWNAKLVESWNNLFPYHFPFIIITLGAAVSLMKKLPIEESGLLLGALIIFFFEIPANYYYSFICLFPMIAYAGLKKNDWKSLSLIIVFFAMWPVFHYIPHYVRDGLIYTYYFCLMILVFYMFWILIRIIDLKEIRKMIDYTPKKATKNK